MASFPSITRGLPWVKEKAARKAERAARREGAHLYRTLGVPSDATYEEVSEAARLMKENAKDVKGRIIADTTKDKIMELRLKLRLQGNLQVGGQAREEDMKAEALGKMLKKNRFSRLKVPKALNGVMVPPDAAHFKSTTKYHALLAGGTVLLPNLSTSFIMLSSMFSLGLLYNRGAPEMPKDDFGNPGEVRSPNAVSVVLTCSLVFGLAAISAVLATFALKLLIGSGGAAAKPFVDAGINLGIIFGFWVACTFFKTYRD